MHLRHTTGQCLWASHTSLELNPAAVGFAAGVLCSQLVRPLDHRSLAAPFSPTDSQLYLFQAAERLRPASPPSPAVCVPLLLPPPCCLRAPLPTNPSKAHCWRRRAPAAAPAPTLPAQPPAVLAGRQSEQKAWLQFKFSFKNFMQAAHGVVQSTQMMCLSLLRKREHVLCALIPSSACRPPAALQDRQPAHHRQHQHPCKCRHQQCWAACTVSDTPGQFGSAVSDWCVRLQAHSCQAVCHRHYGGSGCKQTGALRFGLRVQRMCFHHQDLTSPPPCALPAFLHVQWCREPHAWSCCTAAGTAGSYPWAANRPVRGHAACTGCNGSCCRRQLCRMLVVGH